MLALFVTLFFSVYMFSLVYLILKYPETRWSWDKKREKIKLPDSFIWGTATASHQVEGGCTNNNRFKWESCKDKGGKPRIKDGQEAGDACNHWNLYKEDIELIKDLGVNHYRFSLEWSKIEPTRGSYSQSALDHYSNVIDELIKSDVVPVLTLHHFTNPIWFDDLGGFEVEDNIEIFESFSEKVFSEFSDRVKIWCTINEPAVYSVMGYFQGVFPPGRKNPQLATEVMKNLLVAHTRVYSKLKAVPNGESSRIGLVKNIMQFDPYRRWNLMDWMACRISSSIYNEITLSYLNDGEISVNYPGFVSLKYTDKEAAGKTDFFGLNYYSHVHLKFKINGTDFFENKYLESDTMTDMPYAIYPEGLYRAIKLVETLDKPIIITENGIADDKDDRRELFIERYIYAMGRAIKEGSKVEGYFYWSLMDNFEWAEGYDMKFGLYSVDFKTQKRKLRRGSKAFVDLVKS